MPATNFKPVRLVVTLIDHPAAQFISKIKYPWMGRVVAGANGIHTCPFHHDQVGSGVLLVEHPAFDRVDLMSVYAAEDHLSPVDLEDVAGNFDAPKAQP